MAKTLSSRAAAMAAATISRDLQSLKIEAAMETSLLR